MKKTKLLIGLSLIALTTGAMTACGGGKKKETTAEAVAKASAMTFDELKKASEKEWQEKPNGVFKAFGLTSVLRTVMKEIATNYDWIHYTYTKEDADIKEGDNCFVKNDYKDQALLTALAEAEDKYVCDYTLVQDCRSFATYLEDGILYNFVPSDAKTTLKMADSDVEPLRGIWFNKVFWTNTNYEHCGGVPIENIWQFAGSATDPKHIEKVSFQSPETEAINMSFLASVTEEGNAQRLKDAYKKYYGSDYSGEKPIGEKWVEEFCKNIANFHKSDGDCMKKDQIEKYWDTPMVYFGAFSKMKDAVGKKYSFDLNGNGVSGEETIDYTLTVGGENFHYTTEKDVNAMTTVKWDYTIEGFNGFMYSMDSDIPNNAEYPYTACLFARTLLEQSVYEKAITNSSTPTADGKAGNQYGYYYPAQESSTFPYAKGDWTKAQHLEKELHENYSFLKDVKQSLINNVKTWISRA